MAGGLLGIGITGLQAYQQSLNTVGQNIANAQNPGYSRQETSLQARPAQFSGAGFIGQGVKVGTTHRIVNDFLSTGLRESVTNFGMHSKFLDLANRMDLMVANPKNGITKGLNDFFEAMHAASYDPSSIPAREALISQAEVLANRVRSLDQQITSEAQTVNNNISETIKTVNSLSNQVASLNSDIVAALGMGNNMSPNDLLDQRDGVIKDLSKYISVTVTSQDDGAANIFVGNGMTLVIGGQNTELATQLNFHDSTVLDIILKSHGGDQLVTNKISGGELGGAKKYLNELLFPSRNALGRFAISLSTTLNDQHKLGIDLDNELGQNIFTDMNRADISSKRVIGNQLNTGNGALSIDVNAITKTSNQAVKIHSAGQILSDSGMLTGLALLGDLKLNNVSIRATTVADDSVSPSTDAANSAIAISKAINELNSQHHVTATAEPNVVFLGDFTTGTIASGEFQINNINIVTTGADVNTLIQDINSLKLQTGVVASANQNNNIILTAYDGRNIELKSSTNTPTASFTYFDLSSTTALSKVQRAQISLESELNSIAVAGFAPQNVDFTQGDFPEQQSYLTVSDYSLMYDGSNYSITRVDDNAVVYKGSTIDKIKVDGFTMHLNSGVINAGDRFTLRPTFNAAADFQLQVYSARKFAFAAPIRINSDLYNKGTGRITFDSMQNSTGSPVGTNYSYGNAFSLAKAITPPIKIEFINDTTYRVFDVTNGSPGKQIGPDQIFNPNTKNEIFPISAVINDDLAGAKSNYVYDPGYRIQLTGAPKANDAFTVDYNLDASADNTNVLQIANLQTDKILLGNRATYSDAFSLMVSDIGTQTAAAKSNLNASESLLNQAEDRRSSISGVNLDEAAANILKLQQAYQASAQIINVSKELFDVLISTFRN